METHLTAKRTGTHLKYVLVFGISIAFTSILLLQTAQGETFAQPAKPLAANDTLLQKNNPDTLLNNLDLSFNNASVNQMLAELQKHTDELNTLNNTKDAGQLQKDLAKYRSQLGVLYNDTAMQKYNADMRYSLRLPNSGENHIKAIDDSVNQAFDNPQREEYREPVKKYSQQMRTYSNSLEASREQKSLNQYNRELQASAQSSEYQKEMKDLLMQLRTSGSNDIDPGFSESVQEGKPEKIHKTTHPKTRKHIDAKARTRAKTSRYMDNMTKIPASF